MKYEYSIYAEGALEEEVIQRQLSELGLTEILVEKRINIDSLIRDENSSRDENFGSKWETLLSSGVLTENIRAELTKTDTPEPDSMQTLGYLLRNIGVCAGLTNASIAKMLQEAFRFLHEAE